MRIHPSARMKKILHWLERKIREKGRNLNPNQNPIKGKIRRICPKLNAFIVMNSSTMPQSFHTKRQERRPQEEERVKPWLHKSRFNLPSLHAWPTQ